MSGPEDARDRLIVALDLPTVEDARAMVQRIGGEATFYKVGLELIYCGGLDLVAELVDAGKKVFLDAKLHDIGNTVSAATARIETLGATLLTVHAFPQTIAAAAAGRRGDSPKILGVTVLTSWNDADAADAGYALNVDDLVRRRAKQILDHGADGVICAPTDVGAVRGIVGGGALIVTPGVRPKGSDAGDQKRIATPGEAVALGADHIVVGRPVTRADDPARAAALILEEVAAAL